MFTRRRIAFYALLCVLAVAWPCGAAPAEPASRPVSISAPGGDVCPALAPPSGPAVRVSTTGALVAAVNGASAGDTILIEDGSYAFGGGQYLRVTAPGVTIRSASGNREAVILDGNYQATELIQIVASNVTVAALTLREALHHPIHVMTEGDDTLYTSLYDVHIVDPGQQAIKINPGVSGGYPDGGTIACSHIELTDSGRPHIVDCYTGGVDAHQAWGWTIRDNLIEGFWCQSGLSEHGIHMWRGCRDTVVERNVLRNNARGIGFGLDSWGDARTYAGGPCPSAGGAYVGHYGGMVRNNFVSANDASLFGSDSGFDCGICLAYACGAQVVHNSVASTFEPFSAIEWRFTTTNAEIVNNLVTHNLMPRDDASATLSGNLAWQSLDVFVDGAGGDLHLGPGSAAIDQGAAVGAGVCDDDVDGDARPVGAARDVGADEYKVAAPDAVTDLRVTSAVTGTAVLTATLTWTPPGGAVTTTLRYDWMPIGGPSWGDATPVGGALPGGDGAYTATVPYEGGLIYFALRTENAAGMSDVSNNAFWPILSVFLPFVSHAYAP